MEADKKDTIIYSPFLNSCEINALAIPLRNMKISII